MGTYLSTPVTDKNEEYGESHQLAWGVVDMQGWRKSMEDAHVAIILRKQQEHQDSEKGSGSTDANASATTTTTHHRNIDQHHDHLLKEGVFGVFDGHGGPEVARFCQLYLVSVLQQQPAWKMALQQLPPSTPSSSSVSQPNNDDAVPSTNPPLPPAKETHIGQALVSAFHALDRMIADPARREELIRLRAVKPPLGERQDANSIPPLTSTTTTPDATKETPITNSTPPSDNTGTAAITSSSTTENPTSITRGTEENNPMNGTPASQSSPKEEDCRVNMKGADGDCDHDSPMNQSDDEDDDSVEAVGKEEAAMDHALEEDEEEIEEIMEVNQEVVVEVVQAGESTTTTTTTTSRKYSDMFQRLLSMSAPTGQMVLQLAGGPNSHANSGATTGNAANSAVAAITTPNAAMPSLIRNGRLICNLPDHPIHAGATAIVAVLLGRTLTVANAGDSRAVLCRQDRAYALSFDHKPLQEVELTRIRKAGGFVNQFGRVNGNLNLSRSIGDLKYKQVPNIPPAEQMITAEPDVVQVEIGDHDQFIILGCDGIWDCLTNEKAVAYVRSRIDSMSPTQIGVDMLNDIISEDPRATQGIGGDNMTIMIIDLKPRSRRWRQEQVASSENDPDRPPAAGGAGAMESSSAAASYSGSGQQ